MYNLLRLSQDPNRHQRPPSLSRHGLQGSSHETRNPKGSQCLKSLKTSTSPTPTNSTACQMDTSAPDSTAIMPSSASTLLIPNSTPLASSSTMASSNSSASTSTTPLIIATSTTLWTSTPHPSI